MKQRADVKILDLASKQAVLEQLSRLLSDSRVLDIGMWDVRRMRYELRLERIGYDSPLVLDQEKVWEYPGIECCLIVEPVRAFVDNRDSSAERWGGEELEALLLRTNDSFEIHSNYGVTVLTLGAGAELMIRDLAPPSAERTTTDYGEPAVDLRRAGELFRSRRL